MAKDKSSFLLYRDIIHTVRKLSDENAGQLFKHILSYVNDENPITDNQLVDLVFEPIKQSLKRDLRRYEEIVQKRSLAGQLSAELRKQNQQKSTSVESVQQSSTNSTDSDIVSVSDSVIVKNKKEDTDDFLSKIIEAFRKSYFEINQNEYVLISKGKERAAAGKLLSIYKNKYPESSSEEVIEGLKQYFLECCQIQDDWLQQKMSLSIIVSKFNEINNTIKKTRNGKNRSVGQRGNEIDGIISAVFESKGI